jgi:hypothetical protein
MKNLIVCDVDDYLISWTPHYIKWLWDKKLSEIDTYDSKTWFRDDFIFQEFNKTYMFKWQRSPIKGTCDFIKERLRANDCDILFVSACGANNSHQYTALAVVLGTELYESKIPLTLVCVDHSYEKIDMVKEYLVNKSYDKILVLDDNLKICESFKLNFNCETYNKHDLCELQNIWKKYK